MQVHMQHRHESSCRCCHTAGTDALCMLSTFSHYTAAIPQLPTIRRTRNDDVFQEHNYMHMSAARYHYSPAQHPGLRV
jgi:hypothetical protein